MSYCDFDDEPSLLDDVRTLVRHTAASLFTIAAILALLGLFTVAVLGARGNA